MVGCAMRTKMPTGRYLHGAHGAPYFDKTLKLTGIGSVPYYLARIHARLINLRRVFSM